MGPSWGQPLNTDNIWRETTEERNGLESMVQPNSSLEWVVQGKEALFERGRGKLGKVRGLVIHITISEHDEETGVNVHTPSDSSVLS